MHRSIAPAVSLLLAVTLLLPLAAQAQGTQVIVAPVREMRLSDNIEALGTLRANESADLTATTTNTIADIRFEDGQRVSAGDVLVVMNTREQQAERAEAVAALEEARRQFERVQDLARRGTASAALLDQRRRELETARARLDAVDARLRDRRIVAPFDGVVGLRNVSVGSLLTPGMVVTTLHDDSVMKLDFTVPELFLSEVMPGLQVEARSRAYPDERFRGEVVSVSNEVDPVTRAFRVRALLPNAERRLRPGMLMTLSLAGRERDALLVPEEALLTRGREHSVFVVTAQGEAQRAQQRAVRIGIRVPGAVEVVDGLQAGEQVVTHGAFRLEDGAAVRVRAVDDGSRPLAELLQAGGGRTP
ncbi:MAG: efflux RND transporter periplasmic adaptor subunit [Pseudazoarcus pumilus]|nr:efflux RND transporter periplasmic adaptor subunit [Pseudazoarcus pumilus]